MTNNNFDGTSDETDMHALVGAYALDAVDDVERARFERHLESCADCQFELFEMSETVGRLAATETMSAPAGMRDAVMDRISRTAQVVPPPHLAAQQSASVPVVIQRGSRWPLRLVSVAAAILAFAAVGLGAVAYNQRQDVDAITAQTQLVTSVMTANDAQIKPMPMGDGARSAIVMSPSQGKAVMVASGVPAAPAGDTYQLWTLTASGHPRSAGVWAPGPDGKAAVVIQGDLSTTAAIAVTVEPAGGSNKPTSKPIASVAMA